MTVGYYISICGVGKYTYNLFYCYICIHAQNIIHILKGGPLSQYQLKIMDQSAHKMAVNASRMSARTGQPDSLPPFLCIGVSGEVCGVIRRLYATALWLAFSSAVFTTLSDFRSYFLIVFVERHEVPRALCPRDSSPGTSQW